MLPADFCLLISDYLGKIVYRDSWIVGRKEKQDKAEEKNP
jgi:hypothetical protein